MAQVGMRSRNLFMQPSYNVAQPHGERRGLKGAGISDSAAPVQGGNDLGGCGEDEKEEGRWRAPNTQSSTDLHPFGPTSSLPEIRIEERWLCGTMDHVMGVLY